MKKIVAALAAACVVVSAAVAAQEPPAGAAELAALQQAAKVDKRALVAEKLALTPAEATKFWPAYDACQRDFAQVTRRRSVALEGLVGRDGPLTDTYARSVINELVAIEDAEVRALRKCAAAMQRAIPPRKAARYLQLENKLRTAQDYEIALAFPLGK